MRVFPNGIPESYKEIARQWLKAKYGKDLEDFEILESLKNEVETALGSYLEPLNPGNIYLGSFSGIHYLCMSDFYNKVKEEIDEG